MAYIYVVKTFQSRRHTIPHTQMYYAKPEDTYWAFSSVLNKVELIEVSNLTRMYITAHHNSNRNGLLREDTESDEDSD